MPVFTCEKCGCIDNSACGGTYWTRNLDIWPEESRDKLLCCACASPKYSDGSINDKAGKWHNRFPRMTKEEYDKKVIEQKK